MYIIDDDGTRTNSNPTTENAATDHPKVAEAAVIGCYHPKWSERPLLIVVRSPDGQDVTAESLALQNYLCCMCVCVDLPTGSTRLADSLDY